MKNIFKIITLVTGLIASTGMLSSCKKNLELKAPYQLTGGNAYPNLDAYVNQLNGIYGSFASANYYNGFLSCTAECLTDNVYETVESLVNYQQVANWIYLPNEGYMASVWAQPYNVIYQANIIINGIDAFKTEGESKYNRALGQALAARAIAHFDLLKAFAPELDRNSTKLGVTIKTTTDISFPGRNTVKEVYDAVYADLNKAITLLSNTDIVINSTSNRAYIDVYGAKAALAKVALYAKDYPTAITNASACIAQYPLASAADFPGIWNDSKVNEVIWSIQNNSGDPGSPFPSADIMSFRFDRNTFGIHPSLLGLYNQANDIRFKTYFFIRNTVGGTNNYGLQKYRGKGAASDNLVNFKVFRTGEMYLIRAEAYANTAGQDANASADLNTLKTARISGWVNTAYTAAALTSAIEDERRRELAGEGQRWFDLKRTTRTINRPTAGLGNPNAQIRTALAASSPKWAWPIPESEIRANGSMKQNDGY